MSAAGCEPLFFVFQRERDYSLWKWAAIFCLIFLSNLVFGLNFPLFFADWLKMSSVLSCWFKAVLSCTWRSAQWVCDVQCNVCDSVTVQIFSSQGLSVSPGLFSPESCSVGNKTQEHWQSPDRWWAEIHHVCLLIGGEWWWWCSTSPSGPGMMSSMMSSGGYQDTPGQPAFSSDNLSGKAGGVLATHHTGVWTPVWMMIIRVSPVGESYNNNCLLTEEDKMSTRTLQISFAPKTID